MQRAETPASELIILSAQEVEDIHRGLAERLAAVGRDGKRAEQDGEDAFAYHAEAGRIRALMARVDALRIVR